MNIINLLIDWDWCSQEGVRGIFHMVKTLIDIIRYVVPIGLVIMTSLDIIKKVINPDEKEGQQKIMNRVLAAVIVFFIPVFIQLVFRVIDWGAGYDGSYDNAESGLSRCWN